MPKPGRGTPPDMDDQHPRPAEPPKPDERPANGLANPVPNQQRSETLDERELRLDRREARIVKRERAADLRDLAANRDEVEENLYPAMDD